MPRGGHARSGPAADPNSGRSEQGRNRLRDGWTELPAKPKGRAPSWPLALLSADEKRLWAALWRKPQATMWKRLGQEWQVAAYVRAFLESTAFEAPASLKTAVLRMEDQLGLSSVGLNQLRWRIPVDEVAAKRSEAAAEVEEPGRVAPVRRLRAAAAEGA